MAESYLGYFEQYAEYDAFVTPAEPSNPWISDSTEMWEAEKQNKVSIQIVRCRVLGNRQDDSISKLFFFDEFGVTYPFPGNRAATSQEVGIFVERVVARPSRERTVLPIPRKGIFRREPQVLGRRPGKYLFPPSSKYPVQ